MQPSTTQFLNSLTAIATMLETPGLSTRKLAINFNRGSASIEVNSFDETINKVALKAFVNFMHTLFHLDSKTFRECLAPEVTYTFARSIGGFKENKNTCTGTEDVTKFFDEKFFDITSNFDVFRMVINISGSVFQATTTVNEDKVIKGEKGRYHMVCQEYFKFNEDGKLVEMRSKNSLEKIS
jgi:hypothetical protein